MFDVYNNIKVGTEYVAPDATCDDIVGYHDHDIAKKLKPYLNEQVRLRNDYCR